MNSAVKRLFGRGVAYYVATPQTVTLQYKVNNLSQKDNTDMKMNKWTMALAAAGVVSLSSVAQAQEAVNGAAAQAASGTLTGYVSTGYTMVKDNTAPAGYWNAGDTTNGYSLDVVDLKWAKAQDTGVNATGYTFEIWAGPDADDIGTAETSNTAGTVELMQANVDLRVNVGTGLNLTVGYFQTVVGAETYNYNENAFYSRSFGFQIEPTHHTGVLGAYQAGPLALQFGVANDTTSNGVNADAGNNGTLFLGSVGYTLNALGRDIDLKYAVISGAGADAAENDNHYVEAETTLVEGVTYKLAVDWVDKDVGADDSVIGHYLSYAVNDSVTINARIEMGNVNTGGTSSFGANQNIDGLESYTLGVDWKVWQNVTSRVEWRVDDGDNIANDQETLAVNLIYSF